MPACISPEGGREALSWAQCAGGLPEQPEGCSSIPSVGLLWGFDVQWGGNSIPGTEEKAGSPAIVTNLNHYSLMFLSSFIVTNSANGFEN